MAERANKARRTTIGDIAERAGVSKGAVSYALNGRPGSRTTRATGSSRSPRSSAGIRTAPHARCLRHGPTPAAWSSRDRRRRSRSSRSSWSSSPASSPSSRARSIALTLQLVDDVEDEIEVYRRWWGERRVDGVLMVDLRVDDPRVDALERLGLPAVVVGGPVAGGHASRVWHDEASAVVEAVRYLAALGHSASRGSPGSRASCTRARRTTAFRAVVERARRSPARSLSTDYTPSSGARATRRLLSSPAPPDRDHLRQRPRSRSPGSASPSQMGFSVPDDVSIVGWDDSLISQVVHPPLTAVTRDIEAYGVAATQHLLAGDRGRGRAATSRRRAAN